MNDSHVLCEGLEKTFTTAAEELRVLKGVNLVVPRSTSVVITGASGSGKSTLLSLLGGLDRPTGGSIAVDGWDLASLPERRLSEYRASAVGFVFQFHYLLKDFTALENVALPAYMNGVPRSKAFERARKLLEEMGLDKRLGHFPSQLSGGERQRTAIARALINGPGLILADEPTGNLDAANAKLVRDLLFSLPAKHGTTLVIATHDPGLASEAEMRVELADGVLRLP
jgi:lipoprotein-releasing system ATP-binding protein